MGTFNDAIQAAISGDSWCAPGAARSSQRPTDVPQDLYDDCIKGSTFLQYLNITNHTKCVSLVNSVLATLQASPLWGVDGECQNFSSMVSVYLTGDTTIQAYATFRCMARAYGRVTGVGFMDAEIALVVLFKGQCTVGEFANGLS